MWRSKCAASPRERHMGVVANSLKLGLPRTQAQQVRAATGTRLSQRAAPGKRYPCATAMLHLIASQLPADFHQSLKERVQKAARDAVSPINTIVWFR